MEWGGMYLHCLGLATSFPTSAGAGCNFLGSRRREKVSGGLDTESARAGPRTQVSDAKFWVT